MDVSDLPFSTATIAVALLAVAQGCSGTTPNADDGGVSDAGPSDGSVVDGTGSACVPSPQIHGNLKPLWSTTLGTGIVAPYVATDSANGIVVVGSTYGSITVDGQSFAVGDGGRSLIPFALKLDPSGKLLWHRAFTGDNIVGGAALDSSGDIFIAGGLDALATPHPDFGTGPLSGTFYLVKLDPQGNALWAYSAACAQVSDNLSVAADGTGNVVVAGVSAHPACFAGDAADAASLTTGFTSFVTEFDATGHVKYSKFSGVPLSPIVQFDPSGNLLVAGSVFGRLNATPLADPNATTAVAEKLDPSGNLLWRIGDGAYSTAVGVAAGTSGVVIAGMFSGTIGISQSTTARGPQDLFFAGLDDAGAPTFEKSIPAAGLLIGGPVADPKGGFVVTGGLTSYADLGDGLLAPPGLVVAKFDDSGQLVYDARFAADGGSLAVDTGGNVVLGALFQGAADLGSGILSSPDDSREVLAVARYAPAAPTLGAPRAACPIMSDAGLPEGGRLLGTMGQSSNALALGSDTVYWTTGGDVMREALDGGPPAPVAIAQSFPGPLVFDSNTLYWANAGNVGGFWAPSTGSVVSLSLDGGTPTTLASGQDHPVAIAVDTTNVYYFVGGTVGGDGGASPVNLLSVPRSATAPTTPTTVLSGLVSTGPLAVNAGTLAFATSTPIAGGGDGGFPTFSTQIATVPVTGGTVTPLATSDRAVSAIAIDTANVYWLDSSTNSLPNDMAAADGRLRSVLRTAGAATILVDSQPGPAQLLLTGSTLVWSNAGVPAPTGSPTDNAGLWSVPTDGGTPSGLVTNEWGFGPFAIDAAHVAWVGTFDPRTGVPGLFVKDR